MTDLDERFRVLAETAEAQKAALARHVRFLLADRFGSKAVQQVAIEDVVSETLLEACRLIRRNPAKAPATAAEMAMWLRRIAHFESLEFARRHRSRSTRSLSDDESDLLVQRDVMSHVEGSGLDAVLIEVDGLIGDEDRRLLRLFFEEGLSSREVAERTGLSDDVTRKRKSRLLQRLRDALERRSM